MNDHVLKWIGFVTVVVVTLVLTAYAMYFMYLDFFGLTRLCRPL